MHEYMPVYPSNINDRPKISEKIMRTGISKVEFFEIIEATDDQLMRNNRCISELNMQGILVVRNPRCGE